MDWDQMRNRLFLDTAVFGTYPEALWQRWVDQGIEPKDVTEEDMAAMRDAKPDFIAFNYYSADCAKYVDQEEREQLIADALVGRRGLRPEANNTVPTPGSSLPIR